MAEPSLQLAEPLTSVDSASMDALSVDVPLNVKVGDLTEDADGSGSKGYEEYLKETRKHQRKLLKARTNKATQENKLRSKFFKLASGLAVFVIAASTSAMGFYVFVAGADADPIVLVTWMTAVVVEIIAILQIMAKYLFPDAASGK